MTTSDSTGAHGWGKINRGQMWHILTVDLDRAFAHARLTEHERMLLQFVRERSWGRQARRKHPDGTRAEPEGVSVGLSDLARVWHVPRQRLSQAKKRLAARRILIVKDDLLWVNKDVDQWLDTLRPASLAYARSSLEPVTRTRDTHVTQKCDKENAHELQPVTRTCDTHERASVQCTCAIKEARAGLNSEERLKKTSEEGETRATNDEETCAPTPGGSTPDLAEVKRIAHWAEAASCSLAFGADVGRACWVWGVPWTEEAARRCIAKGRYSGDYLRGILRKWQSQGAPDADPTSNGYAAPNGEPKARPCNSILRQREVRASILAWGEEVKRNGGFDGES